MKTPDEVVAEKITAALLEKALITAEDAKTLAARIARGEVKDTDWTTLLKMAMNKPQAAPKVKEAA